MVSLSEFSNNSFLLNPRKKNQPQMRTFLFCSLRFMLDAPCRSRLSQSMVFVHSARDPFDMISPVDALPSMIRIEHSYNEREGFGCRRVIRRWSPLANTQVNEQTYRRDCCQRQNESGEGGRAGFAAKDVPKKGDGEPGDARKETRAQKRNTNSPNQLVGRPTQNVSRG